MKVNTDVTAEMKVDQFISHFHKKITNTLLFVYVADGLLRKITQRTQPRFNEPSPVKTKAADAADKYSLHWVLRLASVTEIEVAKPNEGR